MQSQLSLFVASLTAVRQVRHERLYENGEWAVVRMYRRSFTLNFVIP